MKNYNINYTIVDDLLRHMSNISPQEKQRIIQRYENTTGIPEKIKSVRIPTVSLSQDEIKRRFLF